MPVRPTLLHRMALVSFLLFRKNLGNLREFFGQIVYRAPWQKIARTPQFIIYRCHLSRAFPLNLIAIFIGIKHHTELHLPKEGFKKFRAILTRKQACEKLRKLWEHQQASTPLNFASKSRKGKILQAVKNFNGPFITPISAKSSTTSRSGGQCMKWI